MIVPLVIIRSGSATRMRVPIKLIARPCHSRLVSRSRRKMIPPRTVKMGEVAPMREASTAEVRYTPS